MGDGGSGGDPENQAQRPAPCSARSCASTSSVPDSDTRGYRIPADNPFVDTAARRGAAPRDLGVRRAQPVALHLRPTRHGGTGAMMIGDVGQGALEEIDYEPARRAAATTAGALRRGTHD